MSFFKFLKNTFNSKSKNKNDKYLQRAYDKGYSKGLADGRKLAWVAGKKEGLSQGWKEAMSKIGNLAEEMIVRKHNEDRKNESFYQ